MSISVEDLGVAEPTRVLVHPDTPENVRQAIRIHMPSVAIIATHVCPHGRVIFLTDAAWSALKYEGL